MLSFRLCVATISVCFCTKMYNFAYVSTWEGGSRRLYDADGPDNVPVSLICRLLVRPKLTGTVKSTSRIQ